MTQTRVDEHNRLAWEIAAEQAYQWSVPVTAQDLEEAKKHLKLKVTPTSLIPDEWLKALAPYHGKKVLLLAGGGGQQGPLLAAAGFEVVILDISANQLKIDQKVFDEHELKGEFIEGLIGTAGVDHIVKTVEHQNKTVQI